MTPKKAFDFKRNGNNVSFRNPIRGGKVEITSCISLTDNTVRLIHDAVIETNKSFKQHDGRPNFESKFIQILAGPVGVIINQDPATKEGNYSICVASTEPVFVPDLRGFNITIDIKPYTDPQNDSNAEEKFKEMMRQIAIID